MITLFEFFFTFSVQSIAKVFITLFGNNRTMIIDIIYDRQYADYMYIIYTIQ